MVEEQKYNVENIKDLPVNPIIEKLVAVSPEEPVVKMVGFVGPSKNDTVRLYLDFSLTEYFEIPKNAILHFTSDPTDKDNRLSVFVKASTEVNIVSIQHSRSRAGDLESSDSPSVVFRIKRPPELRDVLGDMKMYESGCTNANLEIFGIWDILTSDKKLSLDATGYLVGRLGDLYHHIGRNCLGRV